MFSLAMPAFHAEVSKMLADVPAAQWQSYLRYHLVDSASPALSPAFATEHFEFHNKALAGPKEQRARWKRVLGMVEGEAGEAIDRTRVVTGKSVAVRVDLGGRSILTKNTIYNNKIQKL